MGRGRFSRFAALAACLFAVAAAVAAHPARAAQPNILVIVTDDQRQGTLRQMPTRGTSSSTKAAIFSAAS